ncbi:hypothetical protein GCM10011383_07010 [Hymenobacter cavernae]|uniref:Uncharacterized protein n=1 Tax=Hymenobacter cavernae TaxID=2044852 RepID=A0ABQ1TQR8_9BACT|nr:hypothetical protein GCM10011383_07010 [Hymenobacter cavernae]
MQPEQVQARWLPDAVVLAGLSHQAQSYQALSDRVSGVPQLVQVLRLRELG